MAEPPRFLSQDALTGPGVYALDRLESHHAVAVLRLRRGDPATIFDGRGNYGPATVEADDRNGMTVRVGEVFAETRPPIGLTVATGIPKGKRWQMLVEKCTELGAERIIPMLSGRSVVKGEGDAGKWRRWAVEAAKQSRRSFLPEVFEPLKLPEVISLAKREQAMLLLADPQGENPRTYQGELRKLGKAVVMIGPEGGFSDAETQLCAREGVNKIRLSPYVLRIETAAAIACAIIMDL